MLLCVDIGNTHTVAGLVDDSMGSRDGVPRANWRLRTHRDATADELAAGFMQQLQLAGYTTDDVGAIIISSVVPSLAEACRDAAQRYVGVEPIIVG
ncbi:MAG: type III pantothenate kinase, partial [Thermoleophilia bacterium]|nr:type III pantothenate kinase [Thermoleophilia bacterium]